MKRLVVGILAHVDSGKTTLSEGLLYSACEIKKLGRVDHGDSFLDNDSIERNRGITIFSKQALIKLSQDVEITLLDTPGHVDFSAEMERTLQVLDYAILVVSGSEGVQSHTETLWRLLEKHNIPTFIFLNKMDLVWKERFELVEELKNIFKDNFVDFSNKRDQGIYEESIATCDEKLLEEYITTGNINEKALKKAIFERKIFPCYFGSALKLEGVDQLVQALRDLTFENDYSDEFGAKVFKIGRDSQGNRITFMKVTGGILKVKDIINGEKINQLRIYSGKKYSTSDQIFPGQIVAATGLINSYPGQGIGMEIDSESELLEPVLTYKVEIPSGSDPHTVFKKLKQLEEEEPKLYLSWNDHLSEIHVKLMGEMQLDIIKTLIKQRFDLDINFGMGNIVYKETIANVVEGIGHFEPLRHYAEVHLLMEPMEPGSDLTFDTLCSEDILDKNWQRLIISHLEEKNHVGVLTGSAITDMKISLVLGKAHKKHTEGGDFRQATYRGVRQGLMAAESVLLEPWYYFSLCVPSENVGRAMADIQGMSGTIDPPETDGDMSIIHGKCPVYEMRGYQNLINNYTKGKGRLSCVLDGYYPCHNAEDIIEKIGYDPESDIENTSDSVFCQGGSGFIVKWDKVRDHMDLESYMDSIKDCEELDSNINNSIKTQNLKEISESELNEIFEKTYGKIQRRSNIGSKIVKPKKEDSFSYSPKSTPTFQGPEYLLIDGYNLIHSWQELKEMAIVDFGAARDALIDILCNYQGVKQCQLIVVFDAYKVKGNKGSVEQVRNINVVYTKEAETADMYIEKVTHKIGRNHKVRVVTSDGLEQLIIMGHGALRVSSKAFEQEVMDLEKDIREYISSL